jgi:ElaB/YqjD/DUF883 family membrane-anchored ribosome-binding protein
MPDPAGRNLAQSEPFMQIPQAVGQFGQQVSNLVPQLPGMIQSAGLSAVNGIDAAKAKAMALAAQARPMVSNAQQSIAQALQRLMASGK